MNSKSVVQLRPDLSAQYLRNPWESRWGLGLLFSALAEFEGHSVLKIFCSSKGATEEYETLHALDDGLSALCEVLERKGWRATGSALPEAHPLTFAQTAWDLWRVIASPVFALASRFRDARLAFVLPSSDKNSIEPGQEALSSASLKEASHQRSFSLDLIMTQSLMDCVRRKKLGMSAALASLFSESFRNICGADGKAFRWMIPVNVRRKTANASTASKFFSWPKPVSQRSNLAASYVSVSVRQDSSVEQVDAYLRRAFLRKEALGNFLVAQTLCKLGRKSLVKGTRSDLSRVPSTWFGNLSFLGRIEDLATVATGDLSLQIFGPVRKSRRVSICAYLMNNRLHFSVTVLMEATRGPAFLERLESCFLERAQSFPSSFLAQNSVSGTVGGNVSGAVGVSCQKSKGFRQSRVGVP